jgi:sec-independent protein translocase protein TatB
MFDIGFWELAMVAVVALLVVGPERLPKLARTAGMWLGRARRFVGSVKADIEQELRAEELRRVLEQQAKSNPLEEIVEETRQVARDIEKGTGNPVDKAGDRANRSTDATPKQTDDPK